MIPKPVHEIDLGDLQALIDNQVSESKSIEYKRAMPGRSDGDVVPFLATVSSLANTAGGDFILGMEAVDGNPTALPGLEIENLDQERLRIEQLVASGLEPRLPHFDVHAVEVGEGWHILVLRHRAGLPRIGSEGTTNSMAATLPAGMRSMLVNCGQRSP